MNPPSTVIASEDNHSLPTFVSLALVPLLLPGAGGVEEEQGMVVGGGGAGGCEGVRGRRGCRGGLTFYFGVKGEEEDSLFVRIGR